MMRPLHCATLLLFVTAAAADGQQRAEPCTYEECALRVKEATFTTPQMLVRGQHDVELVKLGLFKPAISSFMVRSDSAVAHGRVYDRLYDTGGVLNIAGGILTVASPIIFHGTLRKLAWTAAGIGLSLYGGVLTNRANDALSRAIWWHNRELMGLPPGR